MSYKFDPSEVVAPTPSDVQIQPNELIFRRPLKKKMHQLMYIKNTNPDPNLMLAFKVKTTKQDGYTVQKPSGDIMSGEERLVKVTLQDLTGSDKPDKFLLQFVLIPRVKQEEIKTGEDGKPEFPDTCFKQWSEEPHKRKIYQKKLFVWFLAEGQSPGSNLAPSSAGGARQSLSSSQTLVSDPSDAPPPYSISDSSKRPETPQRGNDTTTFISPSSARGSTPQAAAGEAPPAQPAGINKSVSDTRAAKVAPSTQTPDTPVTAQTLVEDVKNIATASSVEELKRELAEAKAHIASLSGDTGLRLRKVATQVGAEDVATNLKTAVKTGAVGGTKAEGVPVHIVAVLCVVSFLIAFFFF